MHAPWFRTARLAAALIAVSIAAGCGKTPRLEPLAPDAVVLAFGDSLTYGTGATEFESYPAQLERLISRPVVRSGIPGETTAQALARLPITLDAVRPRLLLLCIGGNDLLRRLGKQQAAENVREIVRTAKNRSIDVVLIGTPEPGFSISPPGFYEEIAKEFGIPYEETVIGEVLRDSSLKADPIHPNAQGYLLIAQRIATLLRTSGAL